MKTRIPLRMKATLGGGGALLLLLFSLQILRNGTENNEVPDLPGILPTDAGDWLGVDEPLGATEGLTDQAEDLLQLDTYVNRIYRQGKNYVQVYIGYWKRGSVSPQLVASHTPDRCWVSNGLICVEFAEGEDIRRNLSPEFFAGEWRQFQHPNGESVEVMFWHLVGGQLFSGHEGFVTGVLPKRRWTNFWNVLSGQAQEQYFVRISSNLPLRDVMRDEDFTEFWKGLTILRNPLA